MAKHYGSASSSISTKYPGRPLRSGQIRLVELFPGQWSDPIRCRLSYALLDDEPDYYALSYVWGPPHVTRDVWLDGISYPATKNLESALRHLRYLYPGLRFWIDALCIAQDDIQERTEQVGMMANIYRACTEVLIYLGDALDPSASHKNAPKTYEFTDSNNDLKLMEMFLGDAAVLPRTRHKTVRGGHIFAFIYFLSLYRLPESHMRYTPNAPFADNAECKDTGRTLLSEGLRRLINAPWTPWWDRMWVVQEVVIPSHARVIYGTVSAPWSMFAGAAMAYDLHVTSCCSHITRVLPDGLLRVCKDFAQRISDIETLRNEYRLWGPSNAITSPNGQGLLLLLRKFRGRKSSDPRDKVYALLSLVTATSALQMLPDYSLSVRQVFVTATLNGIWATKSLSVFQSDVDRKARHDLPSWVPDWGAAGDYGPLAARADATELYDASPGATKAIVLGKWQYKVEKMGLWRTMARDISRYPSFPPLGVKGGLVDTVTYTGEIMRSDFPLSVRSTITAWSLDYRRLTSDDSLSQVDRGDFWRLLCADVTHHTRLGLHQRALPDDEAMFVCWALKSERSPYTDGKHQSKVKPVLEEDVSTVYGRNWCSFMRGKVLRPTKLFPHCLSGADMHAAEPYLDERLEWREIRSPHSVVRGLNRSLMPTWGAESRIHATQNTGQLAATQMDHSIMTATLYRRMFVTERGYVGLGPALMDKGDEVYVLEGGKTPFVLRKEKGGNKVLVGDCYVNGWMDGELETERRDEWDYVFLV
ncbi:hypothetical protein M011DRAFT_191332 [Sporormia fimetaria CBS 119925]|uniref:Heterokaryon incompatibility domain-containing protein n=1 Tax=Sporormia fimetaria CBS 119925 TaxID=1340428 RepID=A0A6A6VKB3_9PLEO|nr:hypothetical protein M011DRAFT_191332 [Sporormia fimetaria CBS 119925]